ncbi:hypothetical protein [Nakamurella sp. PAMC28650]|uniref:hypothetical protein n=1 Tax=Nakamurella sp. PAMC28650 TaxID=2762325 RepID=UPI00164E32A0|nr:hypothetical protein [Nakamurella sp. PAMC28650]QNK82508.1 hypothetical protein H7F38_07285 [Nakamurella sp. PAMC28650]
MAKNLAGRAKQAGVSESPVFRVLDDTSAPWELPNGITCDGRPPGRGATGAVAGGDAGRRNGLTSGIRRAPAVSCN